MRHLTNQNKFRVAAFVVTSLLIVTSFQNCAPSGFDEAAPPSLSGDLTKMEEPKYKSAPFAYDVEVNQITYMSCVKNDPIQGIQNVPIDNNIDRFFTFKIGAYDNTDIVIANMAGGSAVYGRMGGIKLTNEFFSYADYYFKPPNGVEPKNQATTDQVMDLLVNSELNKDAQIQVGLRAQYTNDPKKYGVRNMLFTPSTLSGCSAFDRYCSAMFNPLSDFEYVSDLVRTRTGRLLSFSTVVNPRLNNFEATIALNEQEDLLSVLRRTLSDTSKVFQGPYVEDPKVLAVSFTERQNFVSLEDKDYPKWARNTDVDDMKTALGKGFKLGFSSPIDSGIDKQLVLTRVDEKNLLDVNAGGSIADWKCDPRFQYVIVDPQDEWESCPPINLEKLTDKNVNAWLTDEWIAWINAHGSTDEIRRKRFESDLKVMRRHLSPEFWNINPVLRCVVPRRDSVSGVYYSCYKRESEDKSRYKVVYQPKSGDTNSACGKSVTGATGSIVDCPHYVSVCLK